MVQQAHTQHHHHHHRNPSGKCQLYTKPQHHSGVYCQQIRTITVGATGTAGQNNITVGGTSNNTKYKQKWIRSTIQNHYSWGLLSRKQNTLYTVPILYITVGAIAGENNITVGGTSNNTKYKQKWILSTIQNHYSWGLLSRK